MDQRSQEDDALRPFVPQWSLCWSRCPAPRKAERGLMKHSGQEQLILTCKASAFTTCPLTRAAISIANLDFPVPVAPTTKIRRSSLIRSKGDGRRRRKRESRNRRTDMQTREQGAHVPQRHVTTKQTVMQLFKSLLISSPSF